MTFALVEVEALARKAARGAGQEWGMADEAAMAARWLCTAGLDGVGALARALTRPPDARCPLAEGAAMSDSVLDWAGAGRRIENVAVPVLLLPFAAMAAQRLGRPVTLRWDGTAAVTDGTRAAIAAPRDDLFSDAARVTVQVGGTLTAPLDLHPRARPTPQDWSKLLGLAQRSYAPDTERSRRTGAGAGLTDND